MGQSLDQILGQSADNARVNVTIVSNEDDEVASYAVGSLVIHKGNLENRLPTFLESSPDLDMFFSDRMLAIDPGQPGGFAPTPRQPFDANATEKLGVSIQVGLTGKHEMLLAVFGTKSPVTLSPMGDLLVGLGPSLSNSAAGVFVVSFQLPADTH